MTPYDAWSTTPPDAPQTATERALAAAQAAAQAHADAAHWANTALGNLIGGEG